MQSNNGGTDSGSTVLVDSRRVGVWRFGSPGGWPLVWNHGGLSCGMDATVMDEAARSCGAEIIAIDRPGIGRSDLWSMASVGQWGHTVAQVADLLLLDDFAVAGWSGGGPFALACAAAMPGRVRVVATIDGMAPLERLRNVFEIGFLPDELLIPAARWAPWAAAALLQLIRRVPPRVLGWVLPHLAGSRDGAALNPPPLSLLATHREVMSGGVQADLSSLEARDQPAGLFRRDSDKLDVSVRSLRRHLGHDRQRAVGPGADDQPGSAPGSSSSAESGVCPNLSRYGFEGFLLRLRTVPRSMTTSCSYACPSTSIDPNPRSRTSITTPFRAEIQHFGKLRPLPVRRKPLRPMVPTMTMTSQAAPSSHDGTNTAEYGGVTGTALRSSTCVLLPSKLRNRASVLGAVADFGRP